MSHELNLEEALKQAMERHLKQGMAPWALSPANLNDSMAYSLLSPGKRIRPRLSLACARMIGLSEDAVLPSALALEMIHCFTLIHDDLPSMDNDDFRRGRPSNHKVYGEAIALLAGDGLIPLAYDVFLDAAPFVESKHLLKAIRRFNEAIGPRGVVGGQAAEALLQKTSTLDELSRMHAQKTGALFSASLLVPMDLKGINEASEEGRAIDSFAQELGLAFQIADDLEDADETPTPLPTSILFYLSEDETRRLTLDRIERATELLRKSWKDAASPLVAIAAEVARKIRDA